MTKNEAQMISFKIISQVGNALDCYGTAVTLAKKGELDLAEDKFKEGDKYLNESHKEQAALLSAECNNEDIEFSIILIHAQDHLMTTMNYGRLAREIVDIYKEIKNR